MSDSTHPDELALVFLDASLIGVRNTVRIVPLRRVQSISIMTDPEEPGGLSVLVEVNGEWNYALPGACLVMTVAEAMRQTPEGPYAWPVCMAHAQALGIATDNRRDEEAP
jgi:hypothetical protein